MISLGRKPQVPGSRNKQQAAERRQTIRDQWLQLTLQPQSAAPPGFNYLFLSSFLGLRTAFGRRDAPSPASGRRPAIPGLGHISLPPAG